MIASSLPLKFNILLPQSDKFAEKIRSPKEDGHLVPRAGDHFNVELTVAGQLHTAGVSVWRVQKGYHWILENKSG